MQSSSSVDELTEDRPRARQPDGALVPLRPHQLTLLHRCGLFEAGAIDSNGDQLRTRVGIIGDRAGSGKSFVVLSLVLGGFRGDGMPAVCTYGNNAVNVTFTDHARRVKTNAIVVPHSLASQWEGYIVAFCPHLRTLVIKSTRTAIDVTSDQVAHHDVLLVTSTCYNRVTSVMNAAGIKFTRVFFDEIDNMNIPGCMQPDAAFVWFVTASYANLINPRGQGRWSSQLNRHIWTTTGIRSMGYVKTLFSDLASSMPPHHLKSLVVKNADSYVVRSMSLCDVTHTLVKCRTPKTINILNGIVDRMIIDYLNAGDVPSALQFINPANKDTEENIVLALVDKYTRALRILDAKHAYFTVSGEAGGAESTRIEKRQAEMRNRIDSIRERISASNTCCICYETIANKSVVPCCSNSYCLRCISTWLSHKTDCPMCKSSLRIPDLLVVDASLAGPPNPGKPSESSQTSGRHPESGHEGADESGTSDAYSKARNLEILLRRRAHGDKFLVFSSYDRALVNVSSVLGSLGIRFSYLKGNQRQVAATIKAYNSGQLDVLLINTLNYGCGINMERTTDIIMLHKFDTEVERQVIGRAHRPGRSRNLRVWYLLYENEWSELSGTRTQE
jgi:hypothetical protein